MDRPPKFPGRIPWIPGLLLVAAALLLATGCHRAPEPPTAFGELAPGLGYTNQHLAGGPWSIHVVRVDRSRPEFGFMSVHAHNAALGLDTLSHQVASVPARAGIPVAAVNGDFYQRERAHAGDPRGLQISGGEWLSAPQGGVAFWVTDAGEPRIGTVGSRFRVTWPDGSETAFGLNEERRSNSVVLFTGSAGASTRCSGGSEWILEPELEGTHPAPTPTPGARIRAKVREVRTAGDSPITPGTWVLSVGPQASPAPAPPAAGSTLALTLDSDPTLAGSRTGIGGGPVLVRDGQVQKIQPPSRDAYEFSSMVERHPRTAIGWNPQYFFLVEVDGRQPGLSVGVTLEELAAYMAALGCTDALNLDGGGSATLWAEGKVRNSPCDGKERPIANALVVVRTPAAP